MKKLRYFIIIILLLLIARVSYCQEIEKYDILIQNYIDSIKSEDLELIKKEWIALSGNEKAVVYLKNKSYLNYHSYKIHELLFRSKDLKKRFSGVEAVTAGTGFRGRRREINTNREQVIANRSITKQTNQEVVERSRYARPQDNRSVAISYPNQRRQSNQSRIRSRLRGLFRR